MTQDVESVNFPVDNATAFEAIPVSDPRSISAWTIMREDKPVGAAWVDGEPDELFFHITIIDGKVHGKAELLKSLIPPKAWMTIPMTMIAAARYLTRYVDMVLRGTVLSDGEVMLALQRKA